MKRLLALFPSLIVLLVAFACDDDDTTKGGTEVKTQEPNICRLADCPRPATGTACCTPDEVDPKIRTSS